MNDLDKLNRLNCIVDARLRHMVSSGVTPGVSFALLSGDETLTQYFGNESTASVTVPLRPNMYYDLASLTKVVGTTPLLLQSIREGKLQLDEKVAAVLPEFSGGDVTFRELMTHTSGLAGYIEHRDELPPAALRHALLTQLHVDESRGTAVYRDFNLLITGWALEKVNGGVPVQELITANVLKPWGLDATFAPRPDQAVPTTYSPANGLLRGTVHDPKSAILGAHSAAAGLFASLRGMVRYLRVAFGDVAVPSVPANWARALQKDFSLGGAMRSVGFDLRYAPGNSRPFLYHTGYTGTFILFDPTERLGLVVLANRVHPFVHADFLRQRDLLVHAFLQETSTWH
ncbi:serine hydrolase domain-containing protein [Lacticaseibacillus hulanensis]|uniref:serine hydrolase domain-containing protein n=1 Tax=Lacticaseibacillus hulanensis TaxID=2493111 RepID=UPI000FDAC43D|nr:serine hydrolase domain-containing protein [Lacticaseibacillus hulanensis]